MTQCGDTRARLTLYLDNELQGEERSIFEAHLSACESCRSLVHDEKSLVDAVRESKPLYVVPAGLRARVRQSLTAAVTVKDAKAHTKQEGWRVFSRPTLASHWRLAAIALLLILVTPFVVWFLISREDNETLAPSHFALMAADTHMRHIAGQLPLEIVSSTPQDISNWFGNKLKFNVKLPNYQESSGQEKLYKLEGARLVGYKEDYAAYVAYQMKNRPISLVITSSSVAVPFGGEAIQAKGLTFHYDTISGLKVITWSDRGLTYALVSDLEERGQQSCVVCHQGSRDQDFIAPLKLK